MTPKETLDRLDAANLSETALTYEELASLISDSRKLASVLDLVNQLKADAESEMALSGGSIARTAQDGLHRGMSVGFTLAAGRLLKIIEGAQS